MLKAMLSTPANAVPMRAHAAGSLLTGMRPQSFDGTPDYRVSHNARGRSGACHRGKCRSTRRRNAEPPLGYRPVARVARLDPVAAPSSRVRSAAGSGGPSSRRSGCGGFGYARRGVLPGTVEQAHNSVTGV